MSLNINVYEYQWNIESLDLNNHTMMVKYIHNDHELILNLPIPLNTAAINDHIQFYAPTSQWDLEKARTGKTVEDWNGLLHVQGTGVTSTTSNISAENEILPAFDFLNTCEVVL